MQIEKEKMIFIKIAIETVKAKKGKKIALPVYINSSTNTQMKYCKKWGY